MPVERVSKGFKDISASFQVNPLTYDLIAIKNETAIARSLRNLVLTYQGERFFNPILGSKVSRLLFESVDEITASAIQEEITTTINNFEPRVQISSITATPALDDNGYKVIMEFFVINNPNPIKINFFLERIR